MANPKASYPNDQADSAASGGFVHPGAPPPYQQEQQNVYGFASNAPTTQQVVYHVHPQFGPDPVNMTCPSCQASVRTTVKSEPGAGAYLTGFVIALFGCICGCCLIPCCIDAMKVYLHTCPNCKVKLGKYSGSASLG